MAQTYSVSTNREDGGSQDATPVSRDKVTISPEALDALDALKESYSPFPTGEEDAAKARESPWLLPNMGTHSERTLKNGHTEIMTIEDGKLTVREYDGDRLVKSVDGIMGDHRAVLDTTFYDETGQVSQTIHAELAQLKDKSDWSGAAMTRSVTWFEDGKAVRTLGDEMLLRTRNTGKAFSMSASGNDFRRMTGRVDGDADGLLRNLTNEKHNLSYHADIQEFYDNGQLSRSVVIDQSGEFEQKSNRNEDEVDGMPGMTTAERYHDAHLSVVSNDYDRAGNLLREATIADGQEDGEGPSDGRQYQTADISWYKNGELVKHGSGSFQLEESMGHGVSKRPGILDLLGLTAEEYLTEEAQDASELLGRKLSESSASPEFFLEGAGRAAARKQYSSASNMAEWGVLEQPFDVDWTTELYEDGELVMRKQDSQKGTAVSGREVDDRLPFRPVAALSDGDRPSILESSKHSTEIFEDGSVVAMESQETREILQPDDHDPDTLLTLADYDRLNEDGKDGINVVYQGDISKGDPDSRAAMRSMGEEYDLAMDDLYDTYRRVRGPYNATNKESDFWLKGLG
jgi:hypothetical protein